MEEKAHQVAELFRLLANENRLLILCALLEADQTVAQLAESVPNISRPALSQHLSALRLAGVVHAQRSGHYVVYRLADQRIRSLFQTVKDAYCS